MAAVDDDALLGILPIHRARDKRRVNVFPHRHHSHEAFHLAAEIESAHLERIGHVNDVDMGMILLYLVTNPVGRLQHSPLREYKALVIEILPLEIIFAREPMAPRHGEVNRLVKERKHLAIIEFLRGVMKSGNDVNVIAYGRQRLAHSLHARLIRGHLKREAVGVYISFPQILKE